MKMSLLDRILLRTNSVDDVLRAFNKTQQKLTKMSERLRALATENERIAQQKLDQAKALSAEAERATTVASKIHDLTH